MRVGTLIAIPDRYTQFGRVRGDDGRIYSVEASEIPRNAEVDTRVAYKVDIWENDSGLAHSLKEE